MIYLAVICALELIVSTLVIKVMLDERERAETAWARERNDLLQRIQAPQMAAIDHYNRGTEPAAPPAVDVTDDGDADFWEAKEEMADRLAKAEVNGG